MVEVYMCQVWKACDENCFIWCSLKNFNLVVRTDIQTDTHIQTDIHTLQILDAPGSSITGGIKCVLQRCDSAKPYPGLEKSGCRPDDPFWNADDHKFMTNRPTDDRFLNCVV
jgi:hypothetical protein